MQTGLVVHAPHNGGFLSFKHYHCPSRRQKSQAPASWCENPSLGGVKRTSSLAAVLVVLYKNLSHYGGRIASVRGKRSKSNVLMMMISLLFVLLSLSSSSSSLPHHGRSKLTKISSLPSCPPTPITAREYSVNSHCQIRWHFLLLLNDKEPLQGDGIRAGSNVPWRIVRVGLFHSAYHSGIHLFRGGNKPIIIIVNNCIHHFLNTLNRTLL